jgi:hypothetical protein
LDVEKCWNCGGNVDIEKEKGKKGEKGEMICDEGEKTDHYHIRIVDWIRSNRHQYSG